MSYYNTKTDVYNYDRYVQVFPEQNTLTLQFKDINPIVLCYVYYYIMILLSDVQHKRMPLYTKGINPHIFCYDFSIVQDDFIFSFVQQQVALEE